MNCMKCGREIPSDETFCETCLEGMEQYPVRPDTVVLLPNRTEWFSAKKSHQRRQSPEEQIAALEKRCRRLFAALLISWLLLTGVSVAFGITASEWDMNRFLGQNYKTAGETAETDIP